MNLKSGDLRHRVRIEQQIQIKNSYGESSPEWEEIGTFWCQIRPISSRERLLAAEIQSDLTANIVMRYNSAIKASMRAVHVVNGQDATIYNLSTPIRDPESGLDWMTLPASAGINQG